MLKPREKGKRVMMEVESLKVSETRTDVFFIYRKHHSYKITRFYNK